MRHLIPFFFFQIRLLLNIEDSTGPSPLKTRSKAKASLAEKPAKITKVWILFYILKILIELGVERPLENREVKYHMLVEKKKIKCKV